MTSTSFYCPDTYAFRGVGDTQIGFINAGNRSNLYKGYITYQDIVDILPYCKDVVTARVSGQMILDALEFGVFFLPVKNVAFLLTGGNGYTMFKGAEILTDTGLVDNEVVVRYIEESLNGRIPDMYEKPLDRIRWKTE